VIDKMTIAVDSMERMVAFYSHEVHLIRLVHGTPELHQD